MSQNGEYPLTQLYFYLTEGCNLRCRHCWLAPAYQPVPNENKALPFELFKSILDQAGEMGLRTVKLTGGEPLLHPRIREFIDEVHRRRLRLVVETNGVLCTTQLARQIAAGENGTFVSVSLDGADAETHEYVRGVKGCFEAALAGVRNLVQAGIKPQIIMAVMRKNIHQMESVVRLAETLGAGSVKFNPVTPIERGKHMRNSSETLTVSELIEVGLWTESELARSTDLRLYFAHPSAFRPLSRLFGIDGGECYHCGLFNVLGVLAHGTYALCGIGTSVRELVFGHAHHDRLKRIWENSPVLNEIRASIPERLEGICSMCVHRQACLGACLAQNFYASKRLTSSFWFCEAAYEMGCFPPTRLRQGAEKSVPSQPV
jgi:SynChlorMet cassette radical SAM/SPASM protein ScmF